MEESTTLILFFAAILVFGGALFSIIAFTKRGVRQLPVEKYRSRWMEIECRLRRDTDVEYPLCVLNADSLLDKALRERGTPGKTMAERMKQFQGKWTNGNGVWAAHKLRNKIAHEPETVRLDYDRTRQTLSAYKQALKDIGAI